MVAKLDFCVEPLHAGKGKSRNLKSKYSIVSEKCDQSDNNGIIRSNPYYSDFLLWNWTLVDAEDCSELLPVMVVDLYDGSMTL